MGRNSVSMIVTMEISVYPLKNDYDIDILKFIKKVRTHPEMVVVTNAMSTYIQGEFKLVMEVVSDAMQSVYEHNEMAVATMKVVNRKLPIEDGFYKFKS